MGYYSEAHICQCLSRLSTFRRNSPITIYGSRVKSGQDFVKGVLDLSCGLIHLGLKSGDVVAISAFNSDLYLEWLLAITFVGAIAATLNYRWSLEEALFAMEDVKPIMLITDNEYNTNWHSHFEAHSVPSLKWHVLMDTHNRYTSTGNNILTTNMLKMPSPKPQSFNYSSTCNGVAIVCFTSGTTGRPKGVMLSHSALIVQSLAKIAVIGYSENDVYLHTAPVGHVGGLSSALAMLMVGGCHVLMPKFEAESALEAIQNHHVTSFITVPAIMSDIISFIREKKDRCKELLMVKKILNGGGSLSPKLIKDATDIFSGASLFTAYGMTEGCSSLTFITLDDPTKRTTNEEGVCVGKAAPHVELKISTEDSDSDSGHVGVGQILTRGPHLMIGYWGDHHIPGWHKTGDIGRIDDDGNLWLIGRMKGRIKSGGENIYPEEVESVIVKHPGICGSAVIGIPDSRLTEKVVACIQLTHNWKWIDSTSATHKQLCISSHTLHHFCTTNNLTGFKVPKVFIRWNKKFPMTTSGKLRRDQLKTQVMLHLNLLSSSL